MKLFVQEAAIDHIALVGYDPMYGARPVKRAVQSQLETMLAKAILRGEIKDEVGKPPHPALFCTPPH
eukprot:4339969-Pyramimonas_sp.AAC.1